MPTTPAPMRLQLPQPADTRRLGEAIGRAVEPGDCLALQGPIGAGKTTLVQGTTRGTGSPEEATSPSFVILHRYPGSPPLLHADLYRLERTVEIEDLGLEELADDAGAALAIEWSDRCPDGLPDDRLEIALCYAGEGRAAEIRSTGCRSDALWGRLRRELAAQGVRPE